VLCGYDIAKNYGLGVIPELYTLAGPCAGAPDFAASFGGLVPKCIRVVNFMDVVPRVPVPPLYEQVGFFDVGNLPGQQQQNRFKTVPFVSNHDTADNTIGPQLDPDNPRVPLAYAVAMTVDGSPQLYYEDLFRNVAPWITSTTASAIPTRPWVENLIWCHQKLAFKSGDYFVRYQNSQQLLILERGARAIVAIKNDGSSWHSTWVSTAFFANTQLHDYSGTCGNDIWTNGDAWVYINQPPLSYSVWVLQA